MNPVHPALFALSLKGLRGSKTSGVAPHVASKLPYRLLPDVPDREISLALDNGQAVFDVDSPTARRRRLELDLRIVEVQPAVDRAATSEYRPVRQPQYEGCFGQRAPPSARLGLLVQDCSFEGREPSHCWTVADLTSSTVAPPIDADDWPPGPLR